VFLQDPDDLLFRKTIALHALVLVVGQSELQTGLSQWGKVIITWGLMVWRDVAGCGILRHLPIPLPH
jgi:hypothetical protein